MNLWKDYIDSSGVRVFPDSDGDGVHDGEEDIRRSDLSILLDLNGDPVGNGVPDAFDALLLSLDRFYDMGYQRILLREPGLDIDGGSMLSSHWWTMPQWKRDGFENHIKPWLAARSDLDLGVYAGWRIGDLCSGCLNTSNPYCSGTGATTNSPQPNSNVDAEHLFANLRPWNDLGFALYWFDFSSPFNAEFMAFAAGTPDFPHLLFGGEGLPRPPGTSGSKKVDRDAIQRLPYMATVAQMNAAQNDDGSQPIEFDEMIAEVHIVVQSTDLPGPVINPSQSDRQARLSFAIDHRDRGIVIGGVTQEFDEATVRALYPTYYNGFDLGWIDANRFNYDGLFCPEDLDMDGDVDSDDTAFVLNNWGGPGKVLASGDVSGDGVVDSTDLALVQGAHGKSCP